MTTSAWVLSVRVLGKNGMVRLATQYIPLVEGQSKTVMAGMLGVISVEFGASFLSAVLVSGSQTLRATK